MNLNNKNVLKLPMLVDTKKYIDSRGFFFESFNSNQLPITFVQDNISYSKYNVIRGLHYQINKPQGKLIRVISGKILDVIVNLDKKSTDYGKCNYFELSSNNQKSLWIPKNYAHGFQVLSKSGALVLYKVTEHREIIYERVLYYKDKHLKIKWIGKNHILSDKDKLGKAFNQI